MSLKSEGKGSSDQACQTTLRSCSIMVFQGFGIGLFGLYIACHFVVRWSLWAAAQGFTFFAITLPDSFSATRNS